MFVRLMSASVELPWNKSLWFWSFLQFAAWRRTSGRGEWLSEHLCQEVILNQTADWRKCNRFSGNGRVSQVLRGKPSVCHCDMICSGFMCQLCSSAAAAPRWLILDEYRFTSYERERIGGVDVLGFKSKGLYYEKWALYSVAWFMRRGVSSRVFVQAALWRVWVLNQWQCSVKFELIMLPGFVFIKVHAELPNKRWC